VKISASTLLRPLAALALTSSLVGCALPLAPSDPSSDNWERTLGAPLSSAQVGKLAAQPSADTQLAGR
jgi:hypothetical protein